MGRNANDELVGFSAVIKDDILAGIQADERPR